MNAIIENIIKTSPMTIDDNYKIRLRKRAAQLWKRLDFINKISTRGVVEFDNGIAARFYPNTHLTKKIIKRTDRLREIIFEELNAIERIK